MTRFAKMILMASLVLGIFAFVAADDADAGRYWGGGCYANYTYSSYYPSYSCSTIYRPSFRCGSYFPSYSSCYGGFGGYGGYGGGGHGYGGYGGYCVPTSYGQFNW